MSNRHRHRRKKNRKSRSEGPPLFSDIEKRAHDVLRRGYHPVHMLSIRTHSHTGLTCCSTATKRGQSSTFVLAAEYKYRNATLDNDIVSKSRKQISTTLRVAGEFLPSTNATASLHLPDLNSSKLKLQYFHRYAALALSVPLNQSSQVLLSATVGTPSLVLGMEAKYKTFSRCFTHWNAGFSMTSPTYNASVILADNGDLLRLSYVHYLYQSRKITAVAEASRRLSENKNTFAVGASCILDHLTTVKAKFNNRGKLYTLVEHKIKQSSHLTISGEFDTRALNKIPKIGLALSLTL